MASQPTLKVTSHELTYRAKHYHDIRIVKERQLICTSCGNKISIGAGNFFTHPVMGSLQCEKCWDHYNDVEFTSDEEGNDKYCRICGHSSSLHKCNLPSCKFAFCRKCIKRNANQSLLDVDSKKWKCFLCAPKPYWEVRAVCAAVMDSLHATRKIKKKVNSSSDPKWSEKTRLPHLKQQIARTNALQKFLKTLCDDDDEDSGSTESRPSFDVKTFEKDIPPKRTKNISRQRSLRKLYTSHSPETSSDDEIIIEKEIPVKTKMQRRVISSESEDDDSSAEETVSKPPKQLTKRKEKHGKLSDSDADTRANQSPAKALKKRMSNDSRSGSSSGKEFQPSKLSHNSSIWKRMRKKVPNESDKEENVPATKSGDEEYVVSKEEGVNLKAHIIEALKEIKDIFESHVNCVQDKFNECEITNADEANSVITKCTDTFEKLQSVIQKRGSNIRTFYTSWDESCKKKKASRKKPHKVDKDNSANSSKVSTKGRDKSSGNDVEERNEENIQVSDCDADEIFSGDESATPTKPVAAVASESTIIDEAVEDTNEDAAVDQSTPPNCDDSINMDAEMINCTSPVLGSSKEARPITNQTIDKSDESEEMSVDADNNSEEAPNEEADKRQSEKEQTEHLDNTSITISTLLSKPDELNDSLNDLFESSDSEASDEYVLRTEEVDMMETGVSESVGTNEACELNEFHKANKASVNEDAKSTEVALSVTPNEAKKPNSSNLQSNLNSDRKTKARSIENIPEKSKSASEESTPDTPEIEPTSSPPEIEPASSPPEEGLDESVVEMSKDRCSDDDEPEQCEQSTEDVTKESTNTVKAKKAAEFKLPINECEQSDSSSDVDTSCSTVILPADGTQSNAHLNTVTKTPKGVSALNVTSLKEEKTSDVEENKDDEKAAKDALLESNSDDSITAPAFQDNEEMNNEAADSSGDDSDNVRTKKALLNSSNSESSASDAEPKKLNVPPIVAKPILHRKSKHELKRIHDVESDNSVGSRVKRRRLRLDKNIHYMSDKKLRMQCYVVLKRLKSKVLKKYARALKKSRQHQETKAFKSLISLGGLERKHKKNCTNSESSDSLDDNVQLSKSSKDSKNKKGRESTVTGESLMDHLKKVENGENVEAIDENSSDDGGKEPATKIQNDDVITNDDLISEADKIAKDMLLNSDSNIEQDSDNEKSTTQKGEQSKKKKDWVKKKSKKAEKDSEKDADNNDEENEKETEETEKTEKTEKSSWRRDKLLTMKFSDSDSDVEQKKWDKLQKKRKEKENKDNENSDSVDEDMKTRTRKNIKRRRRILGSDSDVKDSGSDSSPAGSADTEKASDSDQKSPSDSDKKKKTKLRRKRGARKSTDSDSSAGEKKSKPRRKRIKTLDSSDNDSEHVTNSQGTPGKTGRKNIRKVLKDKQVAEDTKQAAKEEEERLKRISERQRVYNEMYELRLAGEEKVDKLVLDFDPETKQALITAHESLVKRLKPHQAQGIKFMWDACFESLERVKTSKGSGCILAHCMGLGKTLQVITLAHTLLTHEATQIKTIMIVCPLSTVLNWINEFSTWLNNIDNDIAVYELTKAKKNFDRRYQLERWKRTGGVLIIGYEMFRNLAGACRNMRKAMKAAIMECLVDPGPDLVVCDEGHLLKNEETALSKCMKQIRTLRRIVLTGTPLQNNLTEYHCMVQFVKPNLLGTKKEFLNRFVNPITNGQFDNSTECDVKLMKKRAHVLHKMLEGSVQRFDYSVLTPFLPPKQEYVIFVRLTDVQIKMYRFYLDNFARRHTGVGGSLFADFQALQRIWTHPIMLKLNAEKMEKANEKKRLSSSDTEGSLKDFINDDSTTDSDSDSSDKSQDDSDIQSVHNSNEENTTVKRRTRNNPTADEEEVEPQKKEEEDWWSQFVQPEHFDDIRVSSKLILLFEILKESEEIGDKVLVFSQSLYSLTLIEEFLRRIDDETQEGTSSECIGHHTGSWSLGLDYFRLDGQTSTENRSKWCKIFNKPSNTRARLFLISTRAGGLGINLTAANRVVIFDASWNPSHDVQSIFRIYRFGQKKPCYVYRFLAAGTMEEKIYNRQVTKLSLSCRVVDEQQIERHYSNNDLNELYKFEAYDDDVRLTLNVPKDRLLAEIFSKHKNVVETYHEHDSLLENKAEEELDEEERKQAWLEYEEEKKGKPVQHPMIAYQNNMQQMQQYNMMMNMDQVNLIPQAALMHDYENLEQLIRKDYPNATPEQQKKITTRALMEMYQYWDKQVMYKPTRPSAVPLRIMMPNPINMNAFQQQQQQNSEVAQLIRHLQQKPGEQHNYAAQNVNKNMPGVPYTITPQNTAVYRNVPTTSTSVADDDVVEVPSSTSSTAVSTTVQPPTLQPAVQPANKGQEE